jgi:eukaryotic-like serine/threonine-protein kinase
MLPSGSMSTNGRGLDRLLDVGAPAEPLEEQRVRARLRGMMFGVQADPVRLGRFTVLERLGSGGAGVVYSAWDPQLDRKVALKVLRSGDQGDAEPQLVGEAKALAKLAHPNVVSVFDVIEMSDGEDPTLRVVLAMEYVDGQTVSAWLRRERPSWREIVAVFVAAGEGLAAAHTVGLIHRDFKPSNVMLGKDGRARVLDFGLAKAAATLDVSMVSGDDEGESERSSEAAGAADRSHRRIAGTPPYMAPEQHRAQPWDPRMDQYAFCVALWEALEGAPPFAGSLGALYEAKREGPPAHLGKSIPAHLRRVLVRGLQPNPGDRFATMDALLDVLRVDPTRRRRRAAAISGMATLALVATYGVWSSQAEDGCTGALERLSGVWDDHRRQRVRDAFSSSGRPHAERSWKTMEPALDGWTTTWSATHRESCRAHAMGEQSSELLDLRMSCLDVALRELRATTDVLVDADATVVDQGVALIAALPDLDRCSEAESLLARPLDPVDPFSAAAVETVQQAIADAWAEQTAGHYTRALALAEAALSDAEPLNHRTTIAAARVALGSAHDRMAEPDAARRELVRAVRDAQAVGADELLARATSVLVWVTGDRQGRFEEANAWADLAEGTIERLGGEPRLQADLHAARGALAFSEGRYDDAIAHHEACSTASAKAWGAEHFKVFRCHINLGNVHNRRGEFDRALAAYRQGIEIAMVSVGEAHPLTLTARGNVVGVLEQLGRNAEAVEEGAAVLVSQEAALGPEHPDLSSTLVNMASAHRARGDLDRAVALAERALAIQEKAWGADHLWLATTLVNLAQYRLEQGDAAHAAVDAQRALALQRASLGDEHGDMAHALVVLGRIELARGNLELARTHLERGRTIARDAYGDGHFLVGIADTHVALLDASK